MVALVICTIDGKAHLADCIEIKGGVVVYSWMGGKQKHEFASNIAVIHPLIEDEGSGG